MASTVGIIQQITGEIDEIVVERKGEVLRCPIRKLATAIADAGLVLRNAQASETPG